MEFSIPSLEITGLVMALKRRIKKLTKAMVRRMTGTIILECRECGEEEVEVPSDTKSVVCPYCVQKWIAPPANYDKREKSDKPRGWHFKSYFEHDGKVYSKGEEVTDVNEIKRLKKEHKKESPVTKTAKKRGRKNARTSR